MLRRFVIRLLLPCFLTLKAAAATFTVTSNAGSGTGSLREALILAAANGDTEKDFIVFNLPVLTEAGRTIRIATQLPDVSGNLVIDAGTQPGTKIGVTNTRVIIMVGNNSSLPTMMNLTNVSNVTINGLSFKGNWLDANPPHMINGITAQDVTDLHIGIANNGNSFNNLLNAVQLTRSGNVVLQGNLTGLAKNGVTRYKNYSAFNFKECSNVTVGGDVPADGNVLSDYAQSELILEQCRDVAIQNNFFGTTYTGDAVTGASFIGTIITAYGIIATGGGGFTIKGNVLSGLGNAIFLNGTESSYTITKNRMGVGASSNTNLNNRVAITLTNVTGSGSINDNVIAYNQDGLAVTNSKPVTISLNSFYCNINSAIKIQRSTSPIPTINVISKTLTNISGLATPNSMIELFYTDECDLCQGKTYITTVPADAGGTWAYNGTITGGVVGTVTNSGGATSPFSTPGIVTTNVAVKNAECGADGAITGLAYTNANNLQWLNNAGEVVGNDINLVNIPAGKYQLKVDNGTCSSVSGYYEVKDNSFAINPANMVISAPGCGLTNGRINGITITNPQGVNLTTRWVNNATGLKVADALTLANAGPSSYSLYVKSAAGCEKTYGPVILNNPAAPQIDQTNAVITASPCGQFTGSIKGITATGTGTLTYSWKNEVGIAVSTVADLINKPGGKYRLQVSGEGGCTTISTEIEIPEINGVSLNTTSGRALSASCEKSNGSIIGLQASGATQVIWTRKTDNITIGTNIELKNVPAGDYVLTLKNATCSKTYDFNVNALASTVFPDFTATVTKTCFAFNSGSIALNTDGAAEEPAAFRWVNSAGDNAAFGKVAQILPEGTYKLYLTNKYGCENFYKAYTVGKFPELQIADYGTITHLKCGVGTGSVTATVFTGGKTNYIYQWYDANDVALTGKTENFISDIPPGKYRLNVTDGGCSRGDVVYTIRDDAETPNTPMAANVRLPFAGTAIIKVTDPYTTALYRLYDSPTATQQIDEQRGGTFNVKVIANHSYYVTLTYGYCESARAEVKVTVDPDASSIVNTFTPNGDGINDYWQINGFDANSDGFVSVFTRSGKAVYQSKGYAKPFDGTYQGKQLPAGIYFYTIDLHNGRIVSGSLTILR